LEYHIQAVRLRRWKITFFFTLPEAQGSRSRQTA